MSIPAVGWRTFITSIGTVILTGYIPWIKGRELSFSRQSKPSQATQNDNKAPDNVNKAPDGYFRAP